MLKFCRRYCVQLIIAAMSLAVYIVLFALFAATVSDSCSVIYRGSSTNNNEIAFSTVRDNDGESFYNLNGGCYLFTSNEKRIVADIFMDMQGVQYGDNTMMYPGSTGENTCAVSANVMHRWGLKTGDAITCNGVSFTVTRKLLSQDGVDESFGHSGVVILSYNDEVLSSVSTFSYVFFLKDGDAYSGLKNLVYTDDLKSAAVSSLAASCVIQLVVCAVLIAVCEFFLFRRYRKNYNVLFGDGVPRFKLFRTIFADTCIKYLLPLAVAAVIYFIVLSYYGMFYIAPVLCYLLAVAVICAVLSYVYFKGVE